MIKKCEPWGRTNALAWNGKACRSRGAKSAGWPRMRLGAGEASVAPDRGPLEDRLAFARLGDMHQLGGPSVQGAPYPQGDVGP